MSREDHEQIDAATARESPRPSSSVTPLSAAPTESQPDTVGVLPTTASVSVAKNHLERNPRFLAPSPSILNQLGLSEPQSKATGFDSNLQAIAEDTPAHHIIQTIPPNHQRNQLIQEANEAKETTQTKDSEESKDTTETKDIKDTKDTIETTQTTQTQITTSHPNSPKVPSQEPNESSSLHGSPSPHERALGLQVLDLLMDAQLCVFEYFLQAVGYLGDDLPPLVGHYVRLPDTPRIPKHLELRERCNLIRKFTAQARLLDNYEYVVQIYATIYAFVKDSLTEMHDYVRALLDHYPRCVPANQVTSPIEHLGLAPPGPPGLFGSPNESFCDTTFMAHFVSLFFPGTQFVDAIDMLFKYSDLAGSLLEISYEEYETMMHEVTDLYDELHAAVNIGFCELNVGNYQDLYPRWAHDPMQYELFRALVVKELSFNPDVNEQFELNYENSILRRILNNEIDRSPHLFSDEECKVLDVMEIITFHLDLMFMVGYLLRQFCAIYSRKAGNLQMDNLVGLMLLVLDTMDTDIVNALVDGGTVGLSNLDNFHQTLKVLSDFRSTLVSFAYTAHVPQGSLFFKEEYHFVDVLRKYVDSLGLLLTLVEIDAKRNPTIIIDVKKDEFEELDSTVKDCFFDLTYFTERFAHERVIASLLSRRQ